MAKRMVTRFGVVIVLLFFITTIPVSPGASDNTSYSWPIKKPTHITSTLGEFRNGHLHNGIDFSTLGRSGRPVRAIDRGRVAEVFYKPQTYGLTIIIEHPGGKRSWYSHLERVADSIEHKLNTPLYEHVRIIPAEEIWVERGEMIGIAGETGRGPVHLHLALQNSGGEFINPIGLFEPKLPFNPRPYIDEIYFYPLNGKSWVNGEGKPLVVSGSDDPVLKLWGEISINAVLWNIHPGTGNRSMPEKIMLFKNGQIKRVIDFSVLGGALIKVPTTAIFNHNQTNITPTRYSVNVTPFDETDFLEPLSFNNHGEKGYLELVIDSGQEGAKKIKRLDYIVSDPSLASKKKEKERPESYSGNENQEVEMNLKYSWQYNRIKIELELKGDYEGQPQVQINKNDFTKEIKLQSESRGRFEGWWSPSLERDGWYTIQARLNGKEGTHSSIRRIYLQSLRSDRPGAVASPEGRYTIFSSGGGHSFDCFVTISEVNDMPEIPAGLELVDTPRHIHPDYFQSLEPLILNATIDKQIRNPETVGLYVWNQLKSSWEILSYEESFSPRIREAEIYYFPIIALLRDTMPPRIKKIRSLPQKNRIRIVFEESESGLTDEGITVSNGPENIRYFWNRDRQWLEIPFSEIAESDLVELKVELTDRAGLKGVWQGEVDLR
jgi:hypothetical protein